MRRRAPATPPAATSPELLRKRTAAPPPPPSPRRYRSLADVIRRSRQVPAPYGGGVGGGGAAAYEDVRCEVCGSGERGDELLLCDGCDRGRHLFCLRPIAARVPSGPWFCPACSRPKRVKRFPMMQTKIVDFFQIQKSSRRAAAAAEAKCWSPQDGRRRRRRSLVIYKKRRRILPFIPSEDSARRLKQMASLATALTASNMEFSNELTYMPGMAPRASNRASVEEGGMQVLSKEDREAIELCRTMVKRGQCPPLLVVFDSVEGFTVQADADIKDMTFITEYTGDVDYLENRENDDCDSMMTLLMAADSSNSLVICPDKRGNISRFINGINNHTLEGKKKQNLKCVRYDVDGECHVLLVACRDIACGERLYYDYNGYEQEYPTHHFV